MGEWIQKNATALVALLAGGLVAFGGWAFDAGGRVTQLEATSTRNAVLATKAQTEVTALQLRVVVLETAAEQVADRGRELKELSRAVIQLGAAVKQQGKTLEILTRRLMRDRPDDDRRRKR